MQQITGLVVLVTADRLPGRAVEMTQSVDLAPDQHRMHPRGGHLQPVPDLDRPRRCFHRRCTILRTTGVGVRDVGDVAPRTGRSSRPALPRHSGMPSCLRSSRTRRSARRLGRCPMPCSTISRARRRRARGVKAAREWVAWDIEGLLVDRAVSETAPLHNRRPSPAHDIRSTRHTFSTNVPRHHT